MLRVALVHWPCMDKNGNEIATAVTNLDLHDCARVCLTYGINTLYIVHPNRSQLEFARRILDHWLTGFGGQYNPLRKRALETVRLVADIEEIRRQGSPLMVGTSARKVRGCITWRMPPIWRSPGTCVCCSALEGACPPACWRNWMP